MVTLAEKRADLEARTFELLKTRPHNQTFDDISRATGIKVAWLRHYSRGEAKAPSVHKVERLYVFLSGRSLDV